MIRTPLRPLARILAAREKGENPDVIERENIRLRHEDMRDRARLRAESRLFLLGVAFFVAFAVVGARMGLWLQPNRWSRRRGHSLPPSSLSAPISPTARGAY